MNWNWANFDALMLEWKRDTFLHSSATLILEHPAYLKIIEMGWPVVRYILEDIRDHGTVHWSKALREITKAEVVTPDMAGRLKLQNEAWLDWGYRQRLIS